LPARYGDQKQKRFYREILQLNQKLSGLSSAITNDIHGAVIMAQSFQSFANSVYTLM